MKKALLFLLLLSISILPIFFSQTKQEYIIASIFVPPNDISQIYSMAYQVSNPSSPLFHHFMNSSQIEKLIYNQEYINLLHYLTNHGIKIIMSSLNIIVINATPSQIENYLNTSIEFYQLNNSTYYQGMGFFRGDIVIASNLTSSLLSKPTDLVTPTLISQMEKKAITLNFTYADESYPVTWLSKAYNATVLNATGEGYTIGILDFYGDPSIVQQLAYFDKLYNISPPPSFKIEYIGPPCPFGGILSGWNLEISLDVEVSHAVAPKANIILYVANPNIPLPAVLAKIVQEDKVNVLSQSWGIPESEIVDNPANLEMVYEMNFYYALGSLEGITFLASTGDVGGSGYSTSPIGSVSFPSTSPFVTAVGGTTTYIELNGSAYQTAWSNYGFIPYFINYGGSTGGVSVLFVEPWYQAYIQTPSTYPDGRMVPDISLNANVFPGIQVVFPGNITYVTGGTSEASPLFAGFLTLIMQKDNTTFGLINPLLYYLGEHYYNEAYYPITFGYNIPWVAHYGYNLVTGLGSPNIGEIAYLVKDINTLKVPIITVNLYNGTNYSFYFLPNQSMEIIANITYKGEEITSGNYKAYIYTLQGRVDSIELHFNGSRWIGVYLISPNVVGPIEILVKGNNSEGFTNAFIGYIMSIKGDLNVIYPTIKAKVYNIYQNEVNISFLNITLYEYNPIDNSFIKITNIILKQKGYGSYFATLPINLTAGPILIVGNNVYGYISTFAGSSLLLNTLIIPPVVVEPGVATPGESLFIEPSNIPYGNINISAVLYNNEGKPISYGNLSWVLVPIDGLLAYVYIGYLPIPPKVSQGLYTIILNEYVPLGNGTILEGKYYSQIYIVPQNLSINVKLNGLLTEGSNVKILANITYPNGTEVKFGMFSATVYPLQLQSEYEDLTQTLEIPLWFNGSLWIGNFTLPSTYTLGNLTYLSGNYFGPFAIFISGISADGYPTTNNLNSEREFIVQPYTLIKNEIVDLTQTFYAIFQNDTIQLNGKLFSDILINDTIYRSNLTISNTQFNGIIIIKDSNITLNNIEAEKIIAINSTLAIFDSKVLNLTLINSVLSNRTSEITYLYPALPKILFNGNEIKIEGISIKEINIYDNGKLIYNGTKTSIPISLQTGYNGIKIIVYQTDGEEETEEFNVYITTVSNNSLLILAIVSIAISIVAIALVIIKYRR
ncbi:protease pro-enzyme activation domain-containing protein [Sulfurisphaera javensis]|uniref:Protease pro-enzyme activation domain-containing protein n=1 Tax=Sulfurisphaera javensis TaxID=2049879 RepID=A0AAT9GN70_9CREN